MEEEAGSADAPTSGPAVRLGEILNQKNFQKAVRRVAAKCGVNEEDEFYISRVNPSCSI